VEQFPKTKAKKGKACQMGGKKKGGRLAVSASGVVTWCDHSRRRQSGLQELPALLRGPPAWGAPRLPRAPRTIMGLLQGPAAWGLPAQLEQHSLLPDWPGELLCQVTPGKPTASANN